MSTDFETIEGYGASEARVPEVKLLRRETVLPASPSSPGPFFLSCLDIIWQDLGHNRRLVFYHSPRRFHPPSGGSNGNIHESRQTMVEQLKRSLSLCLVHYFCWCGRLAKGVDPPHRLFVDCNDAGVEFVEASIDMRLSQLASDGFQMKPFFAKLCQEPDHKGDRLFSSPLLSVQVTMFSDGGLALGIAQSHVIADGLSLWHFMVSWGECSRGVPLSLPPLHDRQKLAVPDPSPEKAAWKSEFEVSEEDKAELEAEVATVEDKGRSTGTDSSTSVGKEKEESSPPADASGERGKHRREDAGLEDTQNGPSDVDDSSVNGSQTHSKPGTDLVQWVFTLSASAIKKLKSEAGGGGYTSFEVTCAHFWQRTCVARNAPSGELTYLFAPVNFRSRMVPPLPPEYFGNVVGLTAVIGLSSKIRREALHDTASRIHSKIAEVQNDHLEQFMHWLETHENRLMGAGGDSRRSLGKGLNVASSPWFPAYQVDFGWGKPVAVRTAEVKGDGELVFFGGRPGSEVGDVEICTALPRDVLERLIEDPLFVAKPPCAIAFC